MKYFRFKEFQITDDRSAMKVGTDSVILGAWLNDTNPKSILDIGAGSGLISLMLAQRMSQANIWAVEIEKGACLDAKFNFGNSPWVKRLEIVECDIRNYTRDHNYDLIVSNPPFFTDSLLPDIDARAGARHDHNLSLQELLSAVNRLLSADGVFALVYPYDRQEELLTAANKHHLFPRRILNTRNRPQAVIKRSFIEFSRTKQPIIEETLSIRNNDNNYSEKYKELSAAFYLNF